LSEIKEKKTKGASPGLEQKPRKRKRPAKPKEGVIAQATKKGDWKEGRKSAVTGGCSPGL